MKQKWIGFSAILVGMSASALMQTLVATSMPVIVRDLGGMNLYSWVFGGYMLASTITIPLFARLADIFGRRILYIVGLSIFLTGSALIGTASSMDLLVGYRILQGIGAGAVAPAALASIGDLFGDDERGKMFGIIGAVQVLANLIGPPLGGWITDTYSWRWGFYLVLPIGILAALLALVGLQNKSQFTNWKDLRLDWQGASIIGLGLCLGLVGFQIIGAGNILYGTITCAIGAVLLLLASQWEQKHSDPVIPIPLLQVPSMWKPVVGTLLLGLATNGAIAYFPLYLQKIFSQTATATGFALLPMLLMAGIASGIGGSLANRYPRQTQSAAWMLVTLGFTLLAIFHVENILIMAALIGAGLGLLLPIYLHSAQQTGGEAHLATASGLIQMARNMGGAMGIPLLGAWLAMGENLPAFVSIFVSLVFIGVLGFSMGLISPRYSENNI
ncbi:MAG: MFS transporter [Chloroflexi bacterium]|nr:MFS transporter [Chloroflexota bacterium]